jgi:tripartite-type tricarboxylate transporter receptor subunit TctC
MKAIKILVVPAAVFVALVFTFTMAQAKDFPSKPITIVVGYAAGGGTDTVVRGITPLLSEDLGVTILVQNKGGAGGGVAAHAVSQAKADGYTLLATTSSTFSLEPLINPTVYSNEDFVHVASIGQFQGVMFTKADKPFNTLQELIAFARTENRPIKSASYFQLDKMVIRAIAAKENIKIIPVPVKGGNGAIQAVLGGEVDMAYSGGSWAPHVKSGAAKLLFATSFNHLKMAPNLVSMKDLGYSFGTTNYLTVSAPAGIPPQILDRVSKAFETAMSDPSVEKLGKSRNMDLSYLGQKETNQVIADEIAAFSQILSKKD